MRCGSRFVAMDLSADAGELAAGCYLPRSTFSMVSMRKAFLKFGVLHDKAHGEDGRRGGFGMRAHPSKSMPAHASTVNAARPRWWKRCHIHGEATTWWKEPDGTLVCSRCHPHRLAIHDRGVSRSER